ncbi:RagB/SusD family nutrient uptake outer membrane protein [Neolewinella aurantiaca]|uniref:RagB/SusD family nutrient uptake outer membrane protein n=1 Tax=Neolewinella aurantiaca TaxID=2602767 RepID=A0A5C7FAT7_9BACT|nr:RagB/SusD family nutrient uptake outer membrane protein [Neolewinella aurantiaca]TXF87937.1 RagB/SusD family nutrient uptake outer membrane protein [Neolewinella aurantiaca]
MKLSNQLFAFAIGAGTLFGFTSCGDDFLDRQPIDQIAVEDFYRTESDLESGILAAYTALQAQQFFGESWQIDETPSDDSRQNYASAVDNFSVNSGAAEVSGYWSGRYRLITLANVMIEKAPDAEEASQVVKDRVVAEGRFLRALAYYDLVRIFGGVPLITQSPSLDQDLLLPRSPVNEVYDLIKQDLTFAAETLPAERANGRATSGAARAYLASVHLTLREYTDARDRALEVINSGLYSLMPSYGDLWVRSTYDNNAESIFEVQYAGCESWGTGNMRQAFFAPWNEGITKTTDGWGSLIPTSPGEDAPGTTAMDIWEEGDERRYWSMMEPNNYYPTLNAEDGGYTYPADGAGGNSGNIKKYVMGGGSDVCFMSTPQNGSLMRYSEVILTYAEAVTALSSGISLNEEVVGLVNTLRARAGVEDLEFLDSQLLDLERRREFMFESKRWFDILRKGPDRAIELMRLHGRTLDETKLLFPIPASELEINPNLEQNPGY